MCVFSLVVKFNFCKIQGHLIWQMYYRIRNAAINIPTIRQAPSVPPIAAAVTFNADSTCSFMISDIKNVCVNQLYLFQLDDVNYRYVVFTLIKAVTLITNAPYHNRYCKQKKLNCSTIKRAEYRSKFEARESDVSI